MSLLHAFIAGNIAVAVFNLVGMTVTDRGPPPWWAYAIGWPAVIAVIYFAGQ